jgi:alpha-ketoglutarate-dependent taurine dioxygenase
MKVRELMSGLGAEILDFDLPAVWADDEREKLRSLFRQYHLLLFR